MLITPVLYKGIKYTKEDKPGIAVDFEELKNILDSNFSNVTVLEKESLGSRGEVITFLLRK